MAHGGKAGHVLHDVQGRKGVQAGRGLIQKNQRRLGYQRTCYAQPPPLPSCTSRSGCWGCGTTSYEYALSQGGAITRDI